MSETKILKPIPQYPMMEKLSLNSGKFDTVHQFVEWLSEKNYAVGKNIKGTLHYEALPYNQIKSLIYEFFNIDQTLLAKERQTLLSSVQEINKTAIRGDNET